jgi:hypothetical protein
VAGTSRAPFTRAIRSVRYRLEFSGVARCREAADKAKEDWVGRFRSAHDIT